MNEKEELEGRTKVFALKVIRFVSSLPKNKVTDVLGYQLLKAGTSVGANYREANRKESGFGQNPEHHWLLLTPFSVLATLRLTIFIQICIVSTIRCGKE
ncbi:MAG TPA: four helix bundle protein [Syntrophaceae bacterium]|nr:four helix bundle protein [Syntrophaceae bacterium]